MSKDTRKNETMNKANEGELPVELKAFEARLAALLPRADRLDRDALLFEAGRASTEDRPRHRWAWPSAFWAMTTVAAALLAVVLLRPSGIEYVYVERPVESQAAPVESIPQVVADEPQETLPKPEPAELRQTPPSEATPPRPTMMAAVARNWFGVGSLQSSPRQRQLEALLAQGSDAMRRPSDSPKDDLDTRRRSDPQPYWQLRDRLLEGTITDEPSTAPTLKSPLENGAHS